MWHLGIDLHRKSLTVAAVHDAGEIRPPIRLECLDTEGIVRWRYTGTVRAIFKRPEQLTRILATMG